MGKKFDDYKNIEHNGFRPTPIQAHRAEEQIELIFLKGKGLFGLFSKPKPMHYSELRKAYKENFPAIEQREPGLIDQIVQPEILRQLSFTVDDNGMVIYKASDH